MNQHAELKKSLYEFVRGELDQATRREIESHLRSCPKCRSEVETLRAAFESLPPETHHANTERPAAYWDRFSLRVERRITEDSRASSVSDRLREILRIFAPPRWKAITAVSGAVTVVVVAVGLLMTSGSPGAGDEDPAVRTDFVNTSTKEAVEDYLSSSRMLLVGITNMEPGMGDPVDLGIEQRAARSLIQQARFLSDEGLDERSQELIAELERVLIELANLEENADIPEVEMIRTGVRNQNLLFKIRMAENRLGQ